MATAEAHEFRRNDRAVQAVRRAELSALSGRARCAAKARTSGTPRASAISISFPAGAATCWAIVPSRSCEAVQEQVATLIHVPNTWYTEAQGRWAKALSRAQLWRPGVLLQLGHRGQRSRDQAGPAAHAQRALQDHHVRRRLSRPHAGRDGGHGPAEISRRPRPADGRLRLCPVRRSGGRARD